MLFNVIEYKDGKATEIRTTVNAEKVYQTIRIHAPETFWDDAIADDNEFFDCTLYGVSYSPAEVYRAINYVGFSTKVGQFWDEAKKDIIDEIRDIEIGETRNIFGFDVKRLE